MDYPVERYYKINQFFLSINGLWPYQNLLYACLARTIITIITLWILYYQLLNIFISEMTLEYIIDTIRVFLPIIGSLCHMYARILHTDKFRELFDHMWNDWSLQKTEDEMKIMHEHADNTRSLTIYFSIQIYVSVLLYSIWMFLPEIFDFISPVNESYSDNQKLRDEFFINELGYSYFIRSQICVGIFILSAVMIASFTLFMIFTGHACGMCELLGFVGIIESAHALLFLMDFVGIVIVLSLVLTQMLSASNNTERIFKSIGFITLQLFYLFLYNYMGQKVTDMSSNVCEKVYNSMWYNVSTSEQKPLLLIMRRRFKPLKLTSYKFYVLSIQNFGMILQTAISYCMFIRQI